MKGALVVVVILAIIGLGGFLLVKRIQSNRSQSGDITIDKASNSPSTSELPSEGSVKIAREITIEASEYKFNPSEITVKKGETVKLTLKNEGTMPHNWTIEKMGGASIDTTKAGESSSITLTPSQKGTFTTFCSVGNHKSLGMVGKLIVE